MSSLFDFDAEFKQLIIGTDEAGRGPAAGGVFASAVCFHNKSEKLIEELAILNDSKKLSPKKRESIYDLIKNETINATVCVEVGEIEEINILNASLKAMKLACNKVIEVLCHPELDSGSSIVASDANLNGGRFRIKSGMTDRASDDVLVLADGNKLIKDFNYPQKYIIKGDGQSASIAAASVLAKVTRDRHMGYIHEEFPQYNWVRNAGYLTAEHLAAIDKYGLTPHHRPSFLKKHFAKMNSQGKMLYEVM